MNYIEINLANIRNNIDTIRENYPNYKYYMAVVKSDAYGYGIKTIKAISDKVDYLVVSTLDEALKVRKSIINKPILVLNPIEYRDRNKYVKYNITATIDDSNIARRLTNSSIKFHIKINTGMNRFGVNDTKEFIKILDYLNNIEGIYSHIYYAGNKNTTEKQIQLFKQYLNTIGHKNIPMIHLYQSESLITYKKLEFDNSVRIGDLIYGICEKKEENLKSTFSLISNIVKINKLDKGQTASYDGRYTASKESYIAVLPIGYSSGIPKNHIGTLVYINNSPYKIIDIVMNAMLVEIDDKVTLKDKVYIYRDVDHIIDVSKSLNTVPQELTTMLNREIKKNYIN